MEGALYAGCVFFYGDALFLCSSPFVMYYGMYMAFCNKNRDLFCIMINYLYLCWQIRSKDCFGLKKVFSYYEKTLFKMCCYRAHLFCGLQAAKCQTIQIMQELLAQIQNVAKTVAGCTLRTWTTPEEKYDVRCLNEDV